MYSFNSSLLNIHLMISKSSSYSAFFGKVKYIIWKNYRSDHSTFYLGGAASSSEWSDVDSEEALDSNLDFLYGPGTVWERDAEDSGSGSGSGPEDGDDCNYDDDDDYGTTDSESYNTEDSSSSATLTRPGNLSNPIAMEK